MLGFVVGVKDIGGFFRGRDVGLRIYLFDLF